MSCSLNASQVEAAVIDEDVLEDGQKVQYTGVTKFLTQMPNRLRVDISNERRDRLYLYDGKELTMFAKRLNYSATIPAPPTIAQLADKMEEDYGTSVPLADLFRWGAPSWTPNEITGATDFGPSDIEGTTCEHYLFRQADVDWQLWIQKGDYPLPRKLVITTKTDEARHQHQVGRLGRIAGRGDRLALELGQPKALSGDRRRAAARVARYLLQAVLGRQLAGDAPAVQGELDQHVLTHRSAGTPHTGRDVDRTYKKLYIEPWWTSR